MPPPEISSLRFEISTSPQGGGFDSSRPRRRLQRLDDARFQFLAELDRHAVGNVLDLVAEDDADRMHMLAEILKKA